MFSPGANDPRASVPPNACDSTTVLSSDGGGLWDKPSYLKDTRLERGDREKILLGRMDLASDRAFLVPSQSTSFSSETGQLHERHDQGERERIFGGKREWSTSKLSTFSTQTAIGPTFSNGSSFSTVSKPYPGPHGFYKENCRYGSSYSRVGDAPLAFLTDDNRGGRRDCDLYYATAEAASGSKDTSLVHRTKDLGLHMDDGACFKAGDKMQDFSTTELEEKSTIDCQHGHRASNLVSNSPRKVERDSKVQKAELPKKLGTLEDDFSQVKNVVNKVAVEAKLGFRLNERDSRGENLFVSNSTLGSSLNHSSKILPERVASTAYRRSAFAVGNGFSNELIARLHTSLDTALLSPKSSSQSTVHCSSIGSTLSAENSSTRKRPRLGWGQGLAKYEQKKVEGNISSSATTCGGSSELLASLSTDDEHIALKTSGRLPSTTSSSWDSNHNTERKSKLELCAELSKKSELFCESSEGEVILNEDLGTLNQTGTSQEKAGYEKLERVESSQVQVEQIPSCKSLDALVFDKRNEVSSVSPHRNVTHESIPSVEDVIEADPWAPSCVSGWTKQDILNGVEKLELEIDLVEKELIKLDLDGEDNLQNALAASLANEVEHYKQETCCIAVNNLEEACISEGTSTHQQHADELQVLHSSPFEMSVGCQMEQSQDKPNDACIQAVDFESEDKFIPGIVINSVMSQERVNESGIFDENDCIGTKFLSGMMESLPSSDAIKNDFLLDMQKLHLQSVHALLEENQIQSRQASNPFVYLLPENLPAVDSRHVVSHRDVCAWEHDQYDYDGTKEQMLQKLAKHKHLMRFKEQALALKYRVLKELWRREQLGNCIKKDRSKTFRKFEFERKNGAAFVTQRFSLRLRPTLSGSGKLDAAPDEGKLLSKVVADRCDEHVRPFLKMPAMVLNEKERTYNKFMSKNGLVEDPVSLEQEQKTMNPWNLEERQIFLEKFAAFNKNFSKIASYLEYKTTADCVVFYYKNHKSEDFEKIRRRHHLKKRRDYSRASASYLATTVFPAGGQNREGNSARVEDMISFAFANSSSREILSHERTGPHKSIDRVHIAGPSELRSCISGALKKSTWTKESKAASNLLAVAAGVASGDVMNPCSSSASAFPPKCGIESDVLRESSLGQMSFRSKTPPVGESKASHFLHCREGNGKSMGEQLESQWSDNEKHCFVDALSLYGKDFRRIAQHIKSKTQGQCKAFFSKSRKRLNLDQIVDRSETASGALSEAKLVAVQPSSDSETVKMEEFVVHMNDVTSPEDLHPGESPTTYLEATMKEPQLPVLDARISTDDIKVLSEDDINKASVIEQCFENSHHHTPASSPSSHRTGRTWETNELHCTQAVGQSSPSIHLGENCINKMRILETEGCNCSPAKADDVNIRHTDSALDNEVAVEIATTSCTASSVVLTEHEHLCKRPKLEADSPSISSSVPPELPISKLLAHQVSHAVKPSNATVAIKNIQLHEKAVKVGGETRNRREATSWTQEEKEIFAATIKQHGKDWTFLQERLPLKSLTQIKTYFQNSKAKLGYGPENVGNGSSQAVCSRKRKADETDTNMRSFGKSNSQKAGQLPSNDGGLNANSSVMDQNVNLSVVGAEQLALALLARNSGQVVEGMAAVNDMQRLLKQLCSSGLHTPTAALKKLSAGGIPESAPSAAHFLGTMQGQMLSGSLHASIQQQLFSAYKQPFPGSNHQQQQSPGQSRVQQLQLAQSASKQQPTHGLHQQPVQSLMPVIQNQQPSQSACHQLVPNHHQPLSMPMQVPASSFLSQKIAHQFSQQHASSPLATLTDNQIYSQVAHRFQQHAAHQQQQKQIMQPQQQLQQVAHQLQNTVLPVVVLQHDLPGSATHLHKPVLPSHQQSPHRVSNQQHTLAKQQQQCQLLNQQKAVDHQQVFSPQQQQTVLKHKQQVLIQQQKQLHQTPLAQIAQHQLLHQQQLKNIALQQQLHALSQSQDHNNDTFSLQLLQHLQMKGNQHPLQQNNLQNFNFEESAIAAKQLSKYRFDQQFQTRLTAASVQGALTRIGSGSDMLNPSDVEWKRLLVPQLSPEDSQSSQPESEVSVPAHSRGETCSEGQPGRSGDVKLFGQSLLSQPASSGSKSSSVSPTGSGRFLLRPFSPSLLVSPASVSASSMLPPPKFPGSDSGTSSILDKEIRHSPGHRTHHQGTFLATNMANGTFSRSAVLESPHGGQEAFSCLTHRPIQTRFLEHDTHGESLTTLSAHVEVHKEPREPCRDEKHLHTISGPVKGEGEQNSATFLSQGPMNQLDAAIEYNHAKVDECKLASKSGGKAAHTRSDISNQGLSRGVLGAIKAITTRQNVHGSKSTVGITQVDDHGSLRSAKGLEAPKGSGMVEVPNSVGGRSRMVGHDILRHALHSYLSSSQVINVPKQPVSDDIVCNTSRSHVITTDSLELVPKHLPAAQSTFEEPLRSLDSQEVNSTGNALC